MKYSRSEACCCETHFLLEEVEAKHRKNEPEMDPHVVKYYVDRLREEEDLKLLSSTYAPGDIAAYFRENRW